MWLGILKHKKYFTQGLPKGYELSHELKNVDRPRALPPIIIHYVEKHVGIYELKYTNENDKQLNLMENFHVFNLLTKMFQLYRVEVPVKSAHVSSSVFDRQRCIRPFRSLCKSDLRRILQVHSSNRRNPEPYMGRTSSFRRHLDLRDWRGN